MHKMTKLFAVCALGLGTACGVDTAPDDAKTFNPIRDRMEQAGLLEQAKASDKMKNSCDANALFIDTLKEVPSLMNTLGQPLNGYLCNAIGHPDFKEMWFNAAIDTPPAGKTAEQVKAELTEEALRQGNRSCEDLKFNNGEIFMKQPGEIVPGLCQIYLHP